MGKEREGEDNKGAEIYRVSFGGPFATLEGLLFIA